MICKMYDELYDENGGYITDPRYKEILRLDEMLTNAKIPHQTLPFIDGYAVTYPVYGEGQVMDAVEHYSSYGAEHDLLEIIGLLTPEEEEIDIVKGGLSAENVFARIKVHWDKRDKGD